MPGAVILAMTVGSASAQTTFAVALIRPGSESAKFELDGKTDITPVILRTRDVTIQTCIEWTYLVQRAQVAGPDDLEQPHFDIAAKADEPVKPEQMKLMMQALLAERFKLKFYREQKEMRRYTTVDLPTGAKRMKVSEPGGEPYRENSVRDSVVRSTTTVNYLRQTALCQSRSRFRASAWRRWQRWRRGKTGWRCVGSRLASDFQERSSFRRFQAAGR